MVDESTAYNPYNVPPFDPDVVYRTTRAQRYAGYQHGWVDLLPDDPQAHVWTCQDCGSQYADGDYGDDPAESLRYAVACCQSTREARERRMRGIAQYRDVGDAAADDEDAVRAFMVPALPDRPARMVSCEMELTYDRSVVSRIMDSLETDAIHYVCKGDGSLPDNGVELVFDRLHLWREDAARDYLRSLSALRAARQDGTVGVGFSAGHHIHVSARDEDGGMFTPAHVANLYAVFCHCEDVLYRLAAASWTRHRDSQYAAKLDKGSQTTAEVVANLYRTRDRYQGVNVHPLFNAMRDCYCGAFDSGEWSSCTCHASARGTIEFRLFNASTRPDVIHGWIVLASAMVAHATRPELRGVRLPVNEWNPNRTYIPDVYARQLEYLLSMPLTQRERESIVRLAFISPGLKDAARIVWGSALYVDSTQETNDDGDDDYDREHDDYDADDDYDNDDPDACNCDACREARREARAAF